MTEDTELVPLEIVAQPLACLRHGWATFTRNLALLLPVGVAVHAASICVISLISEQELTSWGLALAVLVTRPLRWGFAYLCLRSVRDEEAHASDALQSFRRYLDVVIADALILVAVIAGVALFVVPGIYLHLRTRFVPYLILDEGLDFLSAIRESWELSRGVWPGLLAINALGWLATGVGALAFVVGIFPALILWDLVLASFYHAVLGARHDSEAPEIAESG